MDKLLKTEEVLDRLGCSLATLYRLRKGGKFPRPLTLGRVNRWPESVVAGWIAENQNGTITIQERKNNA